jgi:hypothetical protein
LYLVRIEIKIKTCFADRLAPIQKQALLYFAGTLHKFSIDVFLSITDEQSYHYFEKPLKTKTFEGFFVSM